MIIPVHQRSGFREVDESLFDMPLSKPEAPRLLVCLKAVRIEAQRCVDEPTCFFVATLFLKVARFNAMSFGEIRIELNAAIRRRNWIDVLAMPESKLGLGESHQCPGFRVIRVDRDGLAANPN